MGEVVETKNNQSRRRTMRVNEVEQKLTARITGLEDEETRMQEWLDCLRRVQVIASQWQSDSADQSTEIASRPHVDAEEEIRSDPSPSVSIVQPELVSYQQSPDYLRAGIANRDSSQDLADTCFEELRDRLVTPENKSSVRQMFGFLSSVWN
jgi:hypothetical protein